jgi:hypothetical protein
MLWHQRYQRTSVDGRASAVVAAVRRSRMDARIVQVGVLGMRGAKASIDEKQLVS